MAVHRYWRVYGKPQSGSNLAYGEIELHDSIGGADLTTGLGANTFASTSHDASHNPEFAIDNTAATRWASHASDALLSTAKGPYWGIDFGAGNEKDIVEIVITARSDAAANQSPSQFAVEYSDDNVTYSPLADVAGIAAWALGESRTYDLTDAGEVRVYHLSGEAISDGEPNADVQVYGLYGEAINDGQPSAPIQIYGLYAEVIMSIAEAVPRRKNMTFIP